jgi:hypothetical protein
MLALNGCGSASHNVAATLTVNAVFTSARETLSAQLTAAPFLPTWTETPPPAPPASPFVSPSPAVGGGGISVCDNATYITDVTIPDGSPVANGTKFVKTWTLLNSGTCAWNTGYKLAFEGGNQLGGADTFVAIPVPAGAEANMSVELIAPSAPGNYQGSWRMRNDRDQPFGDTIYVVITVGAPTVCRRSSRTQVTIAGHAGPENVTIDYGDGAVVTDTHGNYAFTVAQGWSGTVTPHKAKVNPWTFDPEHRTYTNLSCDLLHENFHAKAPPGV